MCSYTPTVGTAAPLRSTHGCAIRMHAGPAAILLYSRGPAAPCHHGAPLPSPDGIYIFKLINIVITAHKSRTHPPGDISYKARTIQGTEYPGGRKISEETIRDTSLISQQRGHVSPCHLEKANLSFFTERRKSYRDGAHCRCIR